MRRRGFVLGCGACAALAAFSRGGSANGWSPPPRFERPDAASDEGGLWALMDREEAQLRRSAFVLRDPALQDYVSGIACRLAGAHCLDVRVYLVRTPVFNANMAPNGMMQVWSGLLLRMSSEAQLAAILGHEIGHFLARHSLERLRDARSRSAVSQFLGLALSAARVPNVNTLAQIAIIAGQYAYSREHEREADRIGLELMARAGYATAAAAGIWAGLLEEINAGKKSGESRGGDSVLFATHPPPEEREKTLAERAAELDRGGAGQLRSDEYRRALAGHRRQFLAEELRRRRFGETHALFDRLLRADPQDGEVRFFKGEAYRMRGQAEDAVRALDTYRAAEGARGAPPELYRSVGLVSRQLGRSKEASDAFRRYLELRPDAEDAELVRGFIS